jgi:hypothetical protein
MRFVQSRVFPFIAMLTVALALFASSAQAVITTIEVDPPNPTNTDSLRITVRGSLANGCQRADSALVYSGGLDWYIFATDSSTEGSICSQVIVPYGYYLDIGPLGAGTYSITVQELLQTEDGLVTDDTTGYLTVGVDCAQVFTHDAGNLEMSISSLGMYGVDPTSSAPSDCGVGFLYDQETTQNLYEGAFLIATGPDQVSDNARNSLGAADNDFQLVPTGELSVLDDIIDGRRQEFTYSAFSDSSAEDPINIGVEQGTWADSDPDGDDYVILQYDIYNLSGSAIDGVYAGLFFDWDFPPGSGDSDDGDYSASDDAGWMKESGQNHYRGLAVLTPPGATSYRYFQNDPEIYPWFEGADPQYDGFTDAEKWSAMTSGFQQVRPIESGDGSHLIATGPLSLSADPEEFVRIAFAVIGATSEAELAASAANARSKYELNAISVTVATSPAGRSFSVDGTTYTEAQTFEWTPGECHTLSTTETQTETSQTTQYVWTDWSDGGLVSHDVCPSGGANYTANFKTQYQVTTTANPTEGGTVSPTSGWFDSGESIQLVATASGGFEFDRWEGSGSGSYTGTANPRSITVNGPITEEARFRQVFSVDYAASDIETIDVQSSHTVSVTYSGGVGSVSGSFYYRKGGRSNFAVASMNDDGSGELTFTLPASQLGPEGIEYYMVISQGTNSVRIPDNDGFYVFRTQLTGLRIATTSAGEYQMIGFPFEPKPASVVSIFDEITDVSAKGWRFGRWNPASEDYFAYPDLTTVQRGHGYWLITSDNKIITASGLSAVPDEVFASERYAEISLESGWNQITNPFAFDVSTDAVEFGSGVEEPFHEYAPDQSGSGYQTVNRLEPYIGYWIYNDGSRSHIRIPYSDAGMTLSAERPAGDDGGWRLHLYLRSGEQADALNVVGVHPAASDGYDALDYHEPPGFMKYVSMSFLITRESGAVEKLAGDFRPPNQTGYAFDVLITGNTGEPVELTTEVESALPPGYRAVLVSQSTGAVFDLLGQSAITLPGVPSESGTLYRLFVGDEEYVGAGSTSDNSLPRSYSLSQNYPNPFNAGTVISYFLPQASIVDIRIYDVLGRPIATLSQEEREAGHHQVSWDGRDAQNREVASGVYFYRLATPGFTATKKMILLR